MKIAGQIHNFATEKELQLWKTALSSANTQTIKDNDCHGVSEDHMLYDWFVTNCFEKIKIAIGDEKLRVMFGMYLNETKPWGIHTDGYHVEKFDNRKTAISFLMPLSVDFDDSLADKSRTIVFNEHAYNNKEEITTDTNNLSKSATHIYEKHLSHNNPEYVKKFTVFDEYQWQRGSLIWWSGNHFHDTDNFIGNGYSSKQAIVIHTYTDC